MPPSSQPAIDLAAVTREFSLQGRVISGVAYGSGHINDTFVVTLDQAGVMVRYILQRINERIFKDVPALMENIQRVTRHVGEKVRAAYPGDASRRALTLIPARDGRPYGRDAQGAYWRCYVFVEGACTFDKIESASQARAAAKAFGEFQGLLVDLPAPRLHETIPGFHDTRRRFATCQRAIAADDRNRAFGAKEEIAFALSCEPIVDVLAALYRRGEIPERTTHNDCKLNNVMLDANTLEGVCVIDLDTVMPGFALHDFGDMVRTATSAAAEDERDLRQVGLRMPIYEALVSGYLSSAQFLNQAERAHLAFSGRLITFEIGLRFLTDYLEGDVYFKTRRPDHNLDRCRTQFALVRSIEAQEGAMQAVMERLNRAA